ncbi:hypothetical protein [Streptomyces sparsogenes]|uniref:hypothetical protein n=1 Tax=Streptomyces sparsogenes TaxID=67365 RepID=UPI003F4D15D6
MSDQLYARAAEYYGDKALATLTIAIGQVDFFIPLALIGKPLAGVNPCRASTPAGVSPSEQWT